MKKLLSLVLALALVVSIVGAMAATSVDLGSYEGTLDSVSRYTDSKTGKDMMVITISDVKEKEEPTEAPTEKPTEAPTEKPTEAPTDKPTEAPTDKPTEAPTEAPTAAPTEKPTAAPTATPSKKDVDVSTVIAPSLQIVVVGDTAETTALKNAFAAAIKDGDPKAALPADVASKLSADLKSVNEFVTAKLEGDVSNIASATVNILFPTKYQAGDKVVVLFGVPNGADTKWISVNGIIESDGSISVILTSTVLEALTGKTFALVVLSK